MQINQIKMKKANLILQYRQLIEKIIYLLIIGGEQQVAIAEQFHLVQKLF